MVMALKQTQNEALVQLVAKLKSAAPDQVHSVVLYGSAAGSDFQPEFSDLNLLIVMRAADGATLKALAPTIDWWTKQGNPVPVVFSTEELRRSADVFAIELIDMQERHRLLDGEDVLATITVPREMHRVQVERELRTALVKLRQGYLQARGEEAVSRLMTTSVSTFATLFRHALLVFGQSAPLDKRAAVEAIGAHVGADVSAVLRVLDIRAQRAPGTSCSDMLAGYLAAVTRVTDEVDHRLG